MKSVLVLLALLALSLAVPMAFAGESSMAASAASSRAISGPQAAKS